MDSIDENGNNTNRKDNKYKCVIDYNKNLKDIYKGVKPNDELEAQGFDEGSCKLLYDFRNGGYYQDMKKIMCPDNSDPEKSDCPQAKEAVEGDQCAYKYSQCQTNKRSVDNSLNPNMCFKYKTIDSRNSYYCKNKVMTVDEKYVSCSAGEDECPNWCRDGQISNDGKYCFPKDVKVSDDNKICENSKEINCKSCGGKKCDKNSNNSNYKGKKKNKKKSSNQVKKACCTDDKTSPENDCTRVNDTNCKIPEQTTEAFGNEDVIEEECSPNRYIEIGLVILIILLIIIFR